MSESERQLSRPRVEALVADLGARWRAWEAEHYRPGRHEVAEEDEPPRKSHKAGEKRKHPK